jgi:hypothetical protein
MCGRGAQRLSEVGLLQENEIVKASAQPEPDLVPRWAVLDLNQ